jgi:hypothetical protein
MTATADQYRKSLRDALDKLDLPKAINALQYLGTDDVTAAFARKMAQPGAFQLIGDRSKRNAFYDALLHSLVMASQHEQAQTYALDLNAKIRIIERFFDEIRASLPQCDIAKFPRDIQFWSHAERASRELEELDRLAENEREKIEALARGNVAFVMPEAIMVKLPDGTEVNMDGAYSDIIGRLSLTLKMLSHEHKLLNNGKLVGPAKPVITDEHVLKAGFIQMYAMSWSAVEDIGNRTLFFGGDIGPLESLGLARDMLPEEMYAQFPEPFIFLRNPSEIEVYDYIANRRLQSWGMQRTMQLMYATSLRDHVAAKGDAAPALTGGPFLTEEEAVTLTAMAEILSFDVFADQERHHGLTLREWVRGYCALKVLAESKARESGTCWVTFDSAELEQGFIDHQIPLEYVPSLIYHMTFGTDSRDLYDCPLIQSRDGQYSLFGNVLQSSNLLNVIFSRLGSLTTQFEKKGQGFEDKLISFFNSHHYPCKDTSFNVEGAQYEYDALLLLDDHLFLIECKNNLLSGNHAVPALRYSKFINDTVKQVKRLKRGLQDRPKVVESLFGRKLDTLTLVPVIVNSMNFSRPPLDGVYISDYSALSKFFDESTISEFHWKDGEKQVRKVIRRLWTGNRPTAQELVTYLEMPPQVSLIREHLTYISHPRPTSEATVFFSGVLDVDEAGMQKAKEEAPAIK